MKWTALAVAGLALAGCGDPIGGCDICTLTARLVGTVRSETGNEVMGASIALVPLYSALGDPCGRSTDIETVHATSDSKGQFTATVGAHSILGPRCIEVSIAEIPALELGPLVDTIEAQFVLPGESPPVVHAAFVLPVR